jgi:hypothetical protein
LLTEIPASLFELKRAAGKGLGLFATCNIVRGTRIIEEAPLMKVPPSDNGTGIPLPTMKEALSHSTPEQRNTFSRLYRRGTTEESPEILEVLAQQDLETMAGPSATSDLLDAIAIFHYNSVDMGEDGEYGSEVFASYSRINHSCAPNVQNSYNPTLKKLTVHATRQIDKGEEILTSYVNLHRTYEQRKTALHVWQVDCECRCCAGPKAAGSKRRRELIFDVDQKLAAYTRNIRARVLGISVPKNAQEALDVAKRLLQLLRDEGLAGMNLAGVYVSMDCFVVFSWKN